METCLGHLKGANSNIALIQTVELHFLNGSATLPLCVSCHLTKKKPKKKNPVPVHFSRCGCFFFSAAFFYHSSCQFCSKQKAQQRCTQSRIFNLDPQSSVSSKFQPSIFIVGQLPDIATAERDKKKCEMTKPDTTLIKEKVW